jgi:hypothetical protein
MAHFAQLYVHTYKKFNFSDSSSMVTLTGYERDLSLGHNYVCLENYEKNVRDLLPNPTEFSSERIGYLFQTIATEYWILNYVTDVKYVGVTGYRRYPIFKNPKNDLTFEYKLSSSGNVIKELTDPTHLSLIAEVLSVYDVIIPRKLHFKNSIAEEFVRPHDAYGIWQMFLNCLAEIAPEYKPKLKWFDFSYSGNFCGPMGMNPLGIFKDYVDIYTRVIRLMLQRLENPWEINNPYQDALSDRWIGWLSERFYAFFIFANNLSVYEVPIAFLEEAKKKRLGFF